MTTGTTDGGQDRAREFIAGVFDVGRLMAAAAAHPVQREALLVLMDKVCSVAPRELDGALQAWREGRAAQAAALLHTLRGSIGTLGASAFAATSRELELAVKAGAADEQLFLRARRELQASVDAALAWLARQPRREAPPPAADVPAVAHWKALLAARDIDAATHYPQLRPALAALGPARAAAIDQAMARLDFAAVLDVLGDLP